METIKSKEIGKPAKKVILEKDCLQMSHQKTEEGICELEDNSIGIIQANIKNKKQNKTHQEFEL